MHQQFINTASTPDWSVYGLNEYLLFVNPDENVYGKVMEEKQNFFHHYKEEVAIKTKPHITLIVFLAKESMEKELSNLIQTTCNHYGSSTVTLHNYGGFTPNVIYLKVQNHQPFKKLTQGLKTIDNFLAAYNCPPIRSSSHPHLSIARRLSEQTYFKAITKYKEQHFFESFTMSHLVLFKRKHQFDACKEVATFNLLPRLSSQTTTTSYQLKLNL